MYDGDGDGDGSSSNPAPTQAPSTPFPGWQSSLPNTKIYTRQKERKKTKPESEDEMK